MSSLSGMGSEVTGAPSEATVIEGFFSFQVEESVQKLKDVALGILVEKQEDDWSVFSREELKEEEDQELQVVPSRAPISSLAQAHEQVAYDLFALFSDLFQDYLLPRFEDPKKVLNDLYHQLMAPMLQDTGKFLKEPKNAEAVAARGEPLFQGVLNVVLPSEAGSKGKGANSSLPRFLAGTLLPQLLQLRDPTGAASMDALLEIVVGAAQFLEEYSEIVGEEVKGDKNFRKLSLGERERRVVEGFRKRVEGRGKVFVPDYGEGGEVEVLRRCLSTGLGPLMEEWETPRVLPRVFAPHLQRLLSHFLKPEFLTVMIADLLASKKVKSVKGGEKSTSKYEVRVEVSERIGKVINQIVRSLASLQKAELLSKVALKVGMVFLKNKKGVVGAKIEAVLAKLLRPRGLSRDIALLRKRLWKTMEGKTVEERVALLELSDEEKVASYDGAKKVLFSKVDKELEEVKADGKLKRIAVNCLDTNYLKRTLGSLLDLTQQKDLMRVLLYHYLLGDFVPDSKKS